MQVFLGIWLLLTLITRGITLKCEVCTDIGYNCSGHLETCPPGHDYCAVTAFESLLSTENLKVNGVVKNCVPSSACESGSTRINLGKKGSSRTSVFCCKDSGCNTELSFKLPPIRAKLNGLQCPACYGLLSESCDDEIVNCAGPETHCLNLTGLIHYGDLFEEVVMKGCASESVCIANGSGATTFPGSSSTITQFGCVAAKGINNKSLGSAGLFFSTIFGSLLTKF